MSQAISKQRKEQVRAQQQELDDDHPEHGYAFQLTQAFYASSKGVHFFGRPQLSACLIPPWCTHRKHNQFESPVRNTDNFVEKGKSSIAHAKMIRLRLLISLSGQVGGARFAPRITFAMQPPARTFLSCRSLLKDEEILSNMADGSPVNGQSWIKVTAARKAFKSSGKEALILTATQLRFQDALKSPTLKAYNLLNELGKEELYDLKYFDYVALLKSLKATSNQRTPERMRQVIEKMVNADLRPNGPVFAYLASAYADVGDVDGVMSVAKEVEQSGLPPLKNMETFRGRAYGMAGKFEDAARIAREAAQNPSDERRRQAMIIINSIATFGNRNGSEEAIKFAVSLAKEFDTPLNDKTYNPIIAFYITRKDIDQAFKWFEEKNSLGHSSNERFYTSLMKLSLNVKQDAEAVLKLYEQVRERKIAVTGSMASLVLQAFAIKKDSDAALALIHTIRKLNLNVSDRTYQNQFALALLTKPEVFDNLESYYAAVVPGETPHSLVFRDLVKGLSIVSSSDPEGKYIMKAYQSYKKFAGQPEYSEQPYVSVVKTFLKLGKFDSALELFKTEPPLAPVSILYCNNAFVLHFAMNGMTNEMWEWIEGMERMSHKIDASTWAVAFLGSWNDGGSFSQEDLRILGKFRKCFMNSSLDDGIIKARGVVMKHAKLTAAFKAMGDGNDVMSGIKKYFDEERGRFNNT
ncbi:hypothetical protein HDU67_009405 [Dinochytrium kinnereticum]|nr:hypothetical protein HDU67_009405 [Dinochytrium kinnereticum]